MRVASWLFIVCAVVAALSVFMPVLDVPVAGHVISKRETLSLHGAASNRKLVRKLLAAYRRNSAARVGGAVLGKVTPHAGGRAKDYLEDAGDAMDALSGISDEDAKQAGRALVALTWIVIGLCALMAALVFFDVVTGVYHRGRIIGALVVVVLVAAIAIAIRIGCGMVAFEANDELGAAAVELGVATIAMPVAATGALLSAVALLILDVRSRRAA
ncbi:MAG TPA: hypothetical protein VFQ65_15375 [Kofleriaceae bacterium]|nr:hypothetical protein [Kofleriaceae bacterium]